MKNMTLENIAAACGGQIYYMREDLAQETAKGVVIDSRQIEPGYIFVATKGERVDGHRFIPDVFAKGALAVICEVLPGRGPGTVYPCGRQFYGSEAGCCFLSSAAEYPGGGYHRQCG